MKKFTRYFAVVTTLGMFTVLVMGSAVTNTGSEHGCGRSWPLCHGQLIPQFAVRTAIEFSHRAVVGVETVLVLVLAALSLYLYRGRKEIQILAPLMVLFLFLQAGLGAWAVMYPQLSAVLALHFGVSLISFASALLTTVFLFEADGREQLRDRPIPSALRWGVWGLAAYSYVVVYLGAYVRHTHADEACRGWPLCNGNVFPGFQGSVGTAFAHRVVAALLVFGILGLVFWTARYRGTRPDLFQGSLFALAAVLLQAFSGALVVSIGLDLFPALAHAAFAGLLFGSLTYLCVHVLRRPAAEASRTTQLGANAPSATARVAQP